MAVGNNLIERYIEYVKVNRGIRSNYDAVFGGNVTITGTLTAGQEIIGAETITSTSANAFSVGRQGTTTPVLNVDASATNVVTGINIVGGAAAAGVTITATSSGTNEPLTINAKGSSNFGTTSPFVVTSASSTALIVGPTGTTNPVFRVNASTASVATGIAITGAAAAAGVTIGVVSSGTDENVNINAKGNGWATFRSDVGYTAGGNLRTGIYIGSTANFGIICGTGAPTVAAAQGTLYLRRDGTTTNDRAYINTTGSTTWTALTTAA